MRQSEKLMTALLKVHHIAGPTKIQTERQNSVYEGMTFVVGNTTFRSRLAKKTPKKKGYFTALCEQPHEKNQAYSLSGYPDKLMITVLDGQAKRSICLPIFCSCRQRHHQNRNNRRENGFSRVSTMGAGLKSYRIPNTKLANALFPRFI